jgi:hypothetical protein
VNAKSEFKYEGISYKLYDKKVTDINTGDDQTLVEFIEALPELAEEKDTEATVKLEILEYHDTIEISTKDEMPIVNYGGKWEVLTLLNHTTRLMEKFGSNFRYEVFKDMTSDLFNKVHYYSKKSNRNIKTAFRDSMGRLFRFENNSLVFIPATEENDYIAFYTFSTGINDTEVYESKVFEQWLELKLPKLEEREAFKYYLASLFMPLNHYQHMLHIHGSGGIGKSTLMDIIQSLVLEQELVLNSSLQQILKNNFSSAQLEGKLIAFLNEVDGKKLNTDEFKKIISKERTTFENKGIDVRGGKYCSNVISVANDIPVLDTDDSISRRVSLLKFESDQLQGYDKLQFGRLLKEDRNYILHNVVIPRMAELYNEFGLFEKVVKDVLAYNFEEIRISFNYYSRFIVWAKENYLDKGIANYTTLENSYELILDEDDQNYYVSSNGLYNLYHNERKLETNAELIGSNQVSNIAFFRELKKINYEKRVKWINGKSYRVVVIKK